MNAFFRKYRNSFILYCSVLIILFGISFYIGKFIDPSVPFGIPYRWGTAAVFGSMGFSVILPILLRMIFHQRAVKLKKTSLEQYHKHQAVLSGSIFFGGLFVLPACLYNIPAVHLYVTVLAALYGIYSAIPYQKKFRGELQFYGIELEEN